MRLLVPALALIVAAPTGARVAAAAPPRAFSQPVAVLPFKNLNQDGAIDWLAKGIAETMVTDLERSGRVKVVERDQLDRALTEILLQGANASDESTAANVGRMVGAKTVVLGSFQKAGRDLRINARFVEVETGVVLETAKATGPITRVFALQDQVVDRLLGGEQPARRPKRKESPKTVKAYELWTKSLSGSDAERVTYLKASLEQDPEFPYALEDLAALEKRIATYRKARESALPAEEGVLWERIRDVKLTAYERALAAENLLKLRRDERRYRALLADAKKLLEMKLPDPPPGTLAAPHDAALWAKFEAEQVLRQRDDAVRSAETYLKRYPAGYHYKEVEDLLQELVEERRRQNGQLEFYAERIAHIEKTREEEKAKLSGDALALRMAQLDGERCDFIWRFTLVIWEKLLEECGALEEKYRGVDSPLAKQLVIEGRYRKAVALGELGRFEEAVPILEAIAKEYGPRDSYGYFAKETLEKEWPRDAVP